MLVLKNSGVQRIPGCEPEPVEKLRKLLRGEDRGHIPQQFLEELLGDIMALEAEQVQRRNQPAHLSWELELLIEACTRITDLEENTHALRGTVKTLEEENQQLRKEPSSLCDLTVARAGSLALQLEELGTQLTQDKANSQKEELEGELQSNIANTVRPSRATQVGPPERMPPWRPRLPEGASGITALSWSLISDSWVTSSLAQLQLRPAILSRCRPRGQVLPPRDTGHLGGG
uniref:Uncharacterized protein n=1 Tax=Myotis myotis TaxID=51298 RepID=A0A7J7ZYP8_MYOMY|nr:hypothetical protein mMyoMyo1_009876 [Myotis myotis]